MQFRRFGNKYFVRNRRGFLMKESRKGFTLAELLIVIVVIGILSAMMMFSSTEAVSSAKASNIISNMTQLKKAANAWYVDNLDRVIVGKDNKNEGNEYYFVKDKQTFSTFIDNGGRNEILKYISNGSSITLLSKNKISNMKEGDYVLVATEHSRKWYACYNLGDKSSRLKGKLAGRKSSIGLLGSTKDNITKGGNNKIEDVYTGQQFVCMLILDLGDLGKVSS